MRITVLSRGGLSVYGGVYDPHTNEAVIDARDGETVGVTIDYPSAPSAASIATDGATATAAAISGTQLSTTLSDVQNGSRVDVTATVGGAVRIVRIRGKSPRETDRYDSVEDLV